MNQEKIQEFAMITAVIGSGISSLLQAQDLLVDMMCKECNIPLSMKKSMLENMNKTIGIQKLE